MYQFSPSGCMRIASPLSAQLTILVLVLQTQKLRQTLAVVGGLAVDVPGTLISQRAPINLLGVSRMMTVPLFTRLISYR